jgi:hypothetical protein
MLDIANSTANKRFIFPGPKRAWTVFACVWLVFAGRGVSAQEAETTQVDKNAELLARRTIERLVLDDAFDAKLRQRIWAGGREVVGVGHYEQSGGGTGRYSLEMTIHDGDSRQTMKQISDGKLQWQRTQVGGSISIRRVDIGRIDEHEREVLSGKAASGLSSAANRLPARLLVGGLVELLSQIASDFTLRLGKGTVERQPVWILRGVLRKEVRDRIQASSGQTQLASLSPTEVRVAIAATPDANGFGAGLPIRIEFWSSPVSDSPVSLVATHVKAGLTGSTPDGNEQVSLPKSIDAPAGRLISLLEVYSMRKIEPSPVERFLFVVDDREGTFVNDTRRYLDRIR